MKLYQINEGLRALLEGQTDRFIDEENGEIFSLENIENLQLARDEKIEGCAVVYKEMTAEAAAIAAEIKNLQKRKEAIEGRAESLKGYLERQLNGEKFKSPKANIAYRRSSKVDVTCLTEDLPAQFVKVTLAPDKTALKEAIKGGAKIDGVQIVETVSMTIK